MDISEELQNFKQWLIRLGYAQSTIQGYISLLRLFFNYLKEQIPGQEHIVTYIAELQQIKLSCQTIQGRLNVINRYSVFLEQTKHGYFKYSNKLLLSLYIYQGLDKQDILNLELKDINLTKGTIKVSGGTQKKNSRILSLKAHQIIPFNDYIITHRGKGRNNK